MSAGEPHIATVVIDRPADVVFAFMADGEQLSRWSFGTWETDIAPDGLITGTSLFDGSVIYVRIDPDRDRLTIDYRLGREPVNLVPRIAARVSAGPDMGLEDGQSVLSLMAWRAAGMDDHRWRKLKASHELEILLIKDLIENENKGRAQ
ncbi:MAG: hypothetical protein AAFW76_00430 [Pseudomonadota bacterium]